MGLAHGKVLLHLAERRRRVVEAEDIYYFEAQGDETDVRLRAGRRLRDVRLVSALFDAYRASGCDMDQVGPSRKAEPKGSR